ncbi:hypothetical protein EXIGLDRAFT_669372 [Exidia glandulosa HHB12029]|uniref:Uncharacterized protein n=1 Tax=Exidia glandulosa HHB12029 TaxID=1314781 RepID=A0A165LZ08_EXIGL|nr:hypothetical protein EXIGLDRAFT_669372 [Exidia glandulosa HHB12029]
MGRISAAKKRRVDKAAKGAAARFRGEKENVPTTRALPKAMLTMRNNAKRDAATIRGFEAKLSRAKDALRETRQRADVAEKQASNVRHLANARLSEVKQLRARVAEQDELLAKQADLQDTVNRLRRTNKTLLMRASRSSSVRHRAVAKALARQTESARIIYLKQKGIVPKNIRRISRNLVALCGVSAARVSTAIGVFARGLGFRVYGSISARQVGRHIREGGQLARLQMVMAARKAKSATVACDGMTHKGRNYTAQNLHIVSETGNIRKYFCGLISSPNHTSETQTAEWKSFFTRLKEIWNKCPLGTHAPMAMHHFTRLIRGMNSDHAADQHKTARLIMEWCQATDREARGNDILVSLPPTELLAVLCENLPRHIDRIGGAAVYQLMSAEERQAVYDEMYRELSIKLGQEAFEQLPASVKRAVDLFVWCGCCMHKDLNATKGGNVSLMAFWAAAGIPGPAKLMNKEQVAASASSDSEAVLRSELAAGAGGVKLAMLCGLLFKNKSDKLGQHESFRIFFESRVGRILAYPGTSNNRFQSYLLAAIALYAEAISYPYMREVRGPQRTESNALNLGPLHEKLIQHCKDIIANPDLLLSLDAPSNYAAGALDGNQWEHPEIVFAVHQRMHEYPHLRGALVAFFTGALEVWERFAAEYRTGGVIDTLSDSERADIFMPNTNDACEGAVGDGRQDMRANGNITLATHNAKSMMRLNGTDEFIETLSDDVLAHFRREARVEDAMGLARQERARHTEERLRVQRERREKEEKQKAAQDALNRRLDSVELCLEIDTMRGWTNNKIDDQLDWHRRWHRQRCGKKCPDTHQIPLKASVKNKQLKLEALTAAVEYYSSSGAACDPGVGSATETPGETSASVRDDFLTSEMTLDDLVMYG